MYTLNVFKLFFYIPWYRTWNRERKSLIIKGAYEDWEKYDLILFRI